MTLLVFLLFSAALSLLLLSEFTAFTSAAGLGSLRLPLFGALIGRKNSDESSFNSNNSSNSSSSSGEVENDAVGVCVDGVCSINNGFHSSSSDTAAASKLEEKILREWKSAAGDAESTETSAAAAIDIDSTVTTTTSTIAATATATAASLTDDIAATDVDVATDVAVEEELVVEVSEDDIAELVKLGYSREEAQRALALAVTNNNNSSNGSDDVVAAAAALLEAEDELLLQLQQQAQQLVTAHDWDDAAAFAAVQQCDGNVTAAHELLLQEENYLQQNFEESVKDMLSNGWEEVVARQSLLAQWTIEQRRQSGHNVTISDELMQSIKPSLHRPSSNSNSSNGNSSSSSSSSSSSKGSSATTAAKKQQQQQQQQQPRILPARVEHVVFECTAATLQQLVIESPVPVLLDIYADWCGPCKQLAPLLQQAAVNAGGQFRVVKVNSDRERAIAAALEVTGLPTVYAMNNGKFTDRFVGMLPGKQLQSFLQRAITGDGNAQSDVSIQQLATASANICNFAGLSSITFKRKEKLFALVDAAMNNDDAFTSTTTAATTTAAAAVAGNKPRFVLSAGVKTALQLINNCRSDIRNEKFRSISRNSRTFAEKIAPCRAAVQLLEVAGFKTTTAAAAATTTTGDSSSDSDSDIDKLQLVHSNTAILSLVQQRVDEFVRDKKFARMKSGAMPTSAPVSSPVTSPTASPVTSPVASPTCGRSDSDSSSSDKKKKNSAAAGRKRSAVKQNKSVAAAGFTTAATSNISNSETEAPLVDDIADNNSSSNNNSSSKNNSSNNNISSGGRQRKQRNKKRELYGSSSWKSSSSSDNSDGEFVEIFGGDSTVTIARTDKTNNSSNSNSGSGSGDVSVDKSAVNKKSTRSRRNKKR